MTKRNNTTAIETIAAELPGELAVNSAVRAAEAHADITAAPTVESITAGITQAVDGLASVFTEMELRRRADNGKLYPVNVDLPAGAEDTGELEMVNALRSLQTFLTGTVCQRLELMLDYNAQRVAQAQAQLRQRRMAERDGRATEHDVETAQRWVENYEYQRALLTIAFTAAQDAYAETIGEEFETKAMREAAQRQKARAQRLAAPKVHDAHAERMARLSR
jgi:hypothetical protein